MFQHQTLFTGYPLIICHSSFLNRKKCRSKIFSKGFINHTLSCSYFLPKKVDKPRRFNDNKYHSLVHPLQHKQKYCFEIQNLKKGWSQLTCFHFKLNTFPFQLKLKPTLWSSLKLTQQEKNKKKNLLQLNLLLNHSLPFDTFMRRYRLTKLKNPLGNKKFHSFLLFMGLATMNKNRLICKMKQSKQTVSHLCYTNNVLKPTLTKISSQYLVSSFKNKIKENKKSINHSIHSNLNPLSPIYNKTRQFDLNKGVIHEQKQLIYLSFYFYNFYFVHLQNKVKKKHQTFNAPGYTPPNMPLNILWSLDYQKTYLTFLSFVEQKTFNVLSNYKGFKTIEIRDMAKYLKCFLDVQNNAVEKNLSLKTNKFTQEIKETTTNPWLNPIKWNNTLFLNFQSYPTLSKNFDFYTQSIRKDRQKNIQIEKKPNNKKIDGSLKHLDIFHYENMGLKEWNDYLQNDLMCLSMMKTIPLDSHLKPIPRPLKKRQTNWVFRKKFKKKKFALKMKSQHFHLPFVKADQTRFIDNVLFTNHFEKSHSFCVPLYKLFRNSHTHDHFVCLCQKFQSMKIFFKFDMGTGFLLSQKHRNNQPYPFFFNKDLKLTQHLSAHKEKMYTHSLLELPFTMKKHVHFYPNLQKFIKKLAWYLLKKQPYFLNKYYTVPQTFSWATQTDWNNFLNYMTKLASKEDKIIPIYFERAICFDRPSTGAVVIQQILKSLNFDFNQKDFNYEQNQPTRFLNAMKQIAHVNDVVFCTRKGMHSMESLTSSFQKHNVKKRQRKNNILFLLTFLPGIDSLLKSKLNGQSVSSNDQKRQNLVSKPYSNANVQSNLERLIEHTKGKVFLLNQQIQHYEDFLKFRLFFMKQKTYFISSKNKKNLLASIHKALRKMNMLKTIRATAFRRLKIIRPFLKQNPEWMVLEAVPVLPPDLRPILVLANDQVAISDLNKLYQKVIFRNERLKRLQTSNIMQTTVSPEMKYAQRLLQESVDALIENGKANTKPVTASLSNLRPLKSLSDMIKGKKGRFRQNLLGKRVDYSGRSVIVVGPELKLYECGLPKEIAIELFQPFLIRHLILKKLVPNFMSAKKILKFDKPNIWKLLEEVMKNRPILLNRAPTLHRLGIQAFQPKLIRGRAILLHPLVCSAFNADFDGDQMAIHIPLSHQACSEAWKLMWSRNNILSPATGDPIILPTQDMILGCYYLTTRDAIKQKNALNRNYSVNKNEDVPNNSVTRKAFKNDEIRNKGVKAVPNETRMTILPYKKSDLKTKFRFFSHLDQVLQIFHQGHLNVHTTIWLKWDSNFEVHLKYQRCMEYQMDRQGNCIRLYSDFIVYRNVHFQTCVFYLKTTPGRVLMNKVLNVVLR